MATIANNDRRLTPLTVSLVLFYYEPAMKLAMDSILIVVLFRKEERQV
jgi:hypothetical protein